MATLWKKVQRELTVSFAGTSMLPTIAPGVSVRMRCTDDVVTNDVIVFVYLDQVVVHRLIRRSRNQWVTRGDAHVVPDMPSADPGAVVGKIVGLETAEGMVPLGAAPRSAMRTLALALVRVSSIFGPTGVRLMVYAMRRVGAAKRSVRGSRE